MASEQFLHGIEARLAAFQPIGLGDLDVVALLNRVDTKFVLHRDRFAEILREIEQDYFALEIGGKRMFHYHSLYFDTDDYDLYRFHHNGRANRLKVRFRQYLDSGLCYFEVKYKQKGARTDKVRIRTTEIPDELGESERALIVHERVQPERLKKKMAICFTRITLVNRSLSERLTLDLNLAFDNMREAASFPQLVVAEVKTSKNALGSPIVRAFKRRHIEQIPFSKYATSVALLEDVKANAFKPNLLRIKRILNAGIYSA